jgi:cytochrome c biogenesis protein CcmG/thiol:disulfide interchange protein DsbE
MGELRLVADGEFVWTWLSFLNQYTRSSVSGGALDQMKNLGFGTGAPAEAALARARVIRREPVVSGANTFDCWFIEIPFARYPLPVPRGAELRDGTMRVWIDTVSDAALRHETAGMMHAPGMPHPVRVQQSMVVRSLRRDIDIPDEIFRFQPPPDATHVTEFGPRTAGVNLTGKPAPAFSVTTMDGTRYDAAKLRGKIVLLDFWTTWCEPCRSEMNDLDAFHREYADAGLVVLGLAVGEEKEIVVRFLRDNAVSYPMARVDVSLAGSFGAGAYPTHVVIDREGVVAAHFSGANSGDRLLQALSKAGLSLR